MKADEKLASVHLSSCSDEALKRVHDEIHRIWDQRSFDAKAHYRAQKEAGVFPVPGDVRYDERGPWRAVSVVDRYVVCRRPRAALCIKSAAEWAALRPVPSTPEEAR